MERDGLRPIERISENNGEIGGEIEKYEYRKRATLKTEVERCS